MCNETCTGFVLAGGKSSRMGQDKALTDYRGRPLIRCAIDVLRELTEDVQIVGDPQRYSFLQLPVLPDQIPLHGPLSGIHAGLKATQTKHNFFLACDLPLMSSRFLWLLLSKVGNHDAVMMRFDDGTVEPLCSVYSVRCLPAIESSIGEGQLRTIGFLPKVHVRFLTETELNESGLSRTIFTNVNTPEELCQLGDPS